MLSLNQNSNQGKMSSADKLIKYLSNNKSTSYVMLFEKFNSGLLTIKSRTKTQNHSLELDDFVDNSGDIAEDHVVFARGMRGTLSTSDGELMLACCWASAESRRNYDMFPEVLGGDDTEQVNVEERASHTCIGFNNENIFFPCS